MRVKAGALADALPNGRFAVLDTPHGHDGCLIALDDLDRIVRSFLDDPDTAESEPGSGAARV